MIVTLQFITICLVNTLNDTKAFRILTASNSKTNSTMENKVRQLHVTIYRYPNLDCTNHGISSKHDWLHCFDGDVEDVKHYVEENGYDIHECLYVVRRMLWGEPHPYLTPLEWAIKTPNGNVSFGSNYAVGDSRWHDWFGHYLPLPIHDRFDSWEDNEALTR